MSNQPKGTEVFPCAHLKFSFTYAGLGGYIYTENLQRCWRVAEALECGIISVNDGLVASAVSLYTLNG